jgi:hypothetical protein
VFDEVKSEPEMEVEVKTEEGAYEIFKISEQFEAIDYDDVQQLNFEAPETPAFIPVRKRKRKDPFCDANNDYERKTESKR